jgi:DNA-binding winged helix-turn-helix (wHTH) protein/tetratricopeptide (TPR) repeat protein
MTMYVLGPFRLDTTNGLLLRGNEPVALGRRAIALLRALVERPGAMVSKEALMTAAWPQQIVEESNLSVQIATLRRALGAAPDGGRWIDTMPRRGYRFVGPVVTALEKGANESARRVDATPAPMAAPQHDAERRQITAMSCELAGDATRADGRDLEEWREAVRAFQRCVSETVGRHGGSIFRALGSSVLILFGYPTAQEHDAEQAVRTGLELCAAVKAQTPDAVARPRCRVGIASGIVIVGDVVRVGGGLDHEIIGDAVNRSARLQASAQSGTVVLDAFTRQLVGDLFDCGDLDPIETSDAIEPMLRWNVVGESVVTSRFEALRGPALSPLVGRDEEINLLLRRWERTKTGDGQIVLISGEPGIGKSRLTVELEQLLRDDPHLRLLYFCSPHHQDSTLFPFIDQLGRQVGFAREDSLAAKLAKLEAGFAQAALSDEDLALLADLMSLPAPARHLPPDLGPQRKKDRTIEALVHQLEGLARQQPMVVVLEDAHWVDATSRELIDLTVERLRSLPVLLIVTFRPEFRASWIGQPHVTMLTLNRLDRRARMALAAHIAGGKALPNNVAEQIADRTDGVPLFVEELTKSVLESGLLREEPRRYVLDRSLPPPAIPTTLHASLMARLDHSPSLRRVAQIGAAIGREFSYALLRAVSHIAEDELATSLAGLIASGLLFQRGMPPQAVYRFKHALVQEVAHENLMRGTRKELHARIAETLEIDFPELMDSQPELFAQHYAEAGLIEKSIDWWLKAGRRAAGRSAMVEAAAHFKNGLDQLALLPADTIRKREELEFLCALGGTLLAIKGMAAPEMRETFARARELWEQLGAPSEFLQVPYGQSRNHAYCGELNAALRIDEDLLRLSWNRNDYSGLILGHASSGRTLMLLGRFSSSFAHFNEVLGLLNSVRSRTLVDQIAFHLEVVVQAYLGIVLYCRGFPHQALMRAKSSIVEARKLAHPPSLATSLSCGILVASQVEDDAALGEWADQLVIIATDQGFPLWQALGTVFRAWALVKNGRARDGMSLLRSGLSAFRATGAEGLMPCLLSLLPRACAIAGQTDEALTLLDDALRTVERTGANWFAAEMSQLKGQLLLRQGKTEQAEAVYRQALSIAHEQEAKLWELRAAVSLVELRSNRRRATEARDLLSPIYGWFTEGFETRDLKEARAVLDEFR